MESVAEIILDADEDGMIESWNIDNGLNPKVDDAGEDPAGDFYDNLWEWATDTNPQDPNSFFDIAPPDISVPIIVDGIKIYIEDSRIYNTAADNPI